MPITGIWVLFSIHFFPSSNRFRGDLSLFEEGKKWIENKTQIPVIGIIPWLNDSFPPEDSLDLLEKKITVTNPEIKVGIIKLPSISNFSDFDPLENEETILIEWVKESQNLSKFDFIILPGSKQTMKDQIFQFQSYKDRHWYNKLELKVTIQKSK